MEAWMALVALAGLATGAKYGAHRRAAFFARCEQEITRAHEEAVQRHQERHA
jgi:hypothetical protein